MFDVKKQGWLNKVMMFFVCFFVVLVGLFFGLDIGVIVGVLLFIVDEFQIILYM